MFSSHTNLVYYIGTKVKDINTGEKGVIYQINTLNTNGIKVKFNDLSKKGYFGIQLTNLVIIT